MSRSDHSDAHQRLVVAVLAFCGIVGSIQFTLIVPVLPRSQCCWTPQQATPPGW
ncbi:hypothetical protein [Microbacterium sp. NIBRBAC000506063]|uniref:hypothetical protein n=1 Tax=Microbacterium sp. NIBRBAC000506063 TaxID=2734618 RepID=UPI001BB4BC8D|nr:hypothetical protein [Microbacterium sp. NIBRBAC000506063]QTV79054.1 hypothetical protein KAE78_07880 [Microbacterium sp. NIBRBAC000506063]